MHGRLQHQGEIEEERALLERLAYQATYDPLTHLYSRAYFNIAAESLLRRAIEKKTKLAFVFFNLDSFKMINDARGYTFGDEVLMAVATRLKQTIPKEVLARIGGDEFVTVLEYIDLNKLKSRLRELIEAMSTPLLIGEEEIHISTSIGVSLYPQHGSTKEDLLLRSDEAMYRAKKQGRGTYVIFSETT